MTLADQPQVRTEPDETSFDRLLRSLSTDPEEAADLYLGLRRRIVRFFEVRGVWQSEVAADTVIDRLTKKLGEGQEFDDVSSYALGIARMVGLEISRSPENRSTDEMPDIASVDPEHDASDTKEQQLSCLDKCLDELPAPSRALILEYYQGEKDEKIRTRRKIAEELGIPANALRNRAVRIRDRLERCVTECLANE